MVGHVNFIEFVGGVMEVKIAVEKKIIEQIEKELTRIVRPVATYNNNTETYLKSVIAEQTDRAVVLSEIVSKILQQSFFNEVK